MSQHDTANGTPQPGFPQGFLWGVATSGHQVEGGTANNQWAQWQAEGRIRSGDEAGLACDWWRDADLDLDLASSLGVNALRLSVEWSRIEPEAGHWDRSALARYRSILESVVRRGFRPFITLHHFTHPIWFEQVGGFLNPRSVALFERFTRKVVESLGDLCTDWCTINEPNVFTALGYQAGLFPPGRRNSLLDSARVTLHLCRAHTVAYHAIHGIQPNANVGWAQHYVVLVPRRPANFFDRVLQRAQHRLFNENFVEGIEHGRAPFPLNFMGEDLAEMKGCTDYAGVNYYSRMHVTFDINRSETMFGNLTVPADAPQGDHGVDMPYGEAYPEGLSIAIRRFAQLGKPVYVLENGVPDRDDRIRPALLNDSVEHMRAMLAEGVDLRGYFHWTLTDNFEWNEGWHLRFGLFALDPATQVRTARPSAAVYAEIIRRERGTVDDNAVSAESSHPSRW